MPKLYPIYRYMPSFRVVIVEGYLAFYKAKEQEGVVEIHRLIHGRMNIPKQMQE